MSVDRLRANIRAMEGYTPGEQPLGGAVIKLNTNENPYPPSPHVLEAIHEVIKSDALRKYPDPTGSSFRRAAGEHLGVDPSCILIGNGSDDILTIVTRAFVPQGGKIATPMPGYLLYRTLAEIQGAQLTSVPFTEGWQLPRPWPVNDAHLTFVANPNSPSGTKIGIEPLLQLREESRGPLIIDEAYADFADSSAIELAGRDGIVLTRTMSKSYSLAGIRFGFAIAEPRLVKELVKVKDSYNCDLISLAAAEAAIRDQEWMTRNRDRIRETRKHAASVLSRLGFDVLPSQANFLWCVRVDSRCKQLYEQLRERRILVRYMNYTGLSEGLRISIGTDAEMDMLFHNLESLV